MRVKTKTQWLLSVVALIFLFTIPQMPFFNSPYLLRLLIGVGITVIICLGLNILTGYCGQLNIGQSAFVMVGAFTSGLLNSHLSWPFWACVIPAGLASAVIGAIFGIPSVRLKGLYLALTTLGAQIILTWIASLYSANGSYLVSDP
jgi:branched-chain amino acid transport system permease protein